MSNFDLDHIPLLVVVFAMPECGACEAYLPRFERKVNHDGAFQFYWPEATMDGHKIPVFVFDVSSASPKVQQFADRFAVSATPTTVVVKRPGGVLKAEGSLSDAQIDALLGLAKQHAYG